jgi:phosphatidylinositol alpha-1,6-mannosyltransferase
MSSSGSLESGLIRQHNRIVLLSSELPPGPGGIGTHAHEVARGLSACGWAVDMLAPQPYASEEEIIRFNDAEPYYVHRLNSGRGAVLEASRRWSRLKGVLESSRPTVALASGERMVWLAAAMGRRMPPWVAVGHGSEFGPRGVRRVLSRWAWSRAAAVVCVSNFTAKTMRSAGICPRKSVVIPNGADHLRFRPLDRCQVESARRRLGLGNGRVLLTVGNVTVRKGQDAVVQALPRILESVPDLHYVIAGLPTEREKVEAVARELDVTERVHVVGRVGDEEVVELMNLADLFVMTSRTTRDGDCEGFGIAVVEAALCGTPAVVSVGSGLTEAIIDGETGRAVPQDDVEAIERAVVDLMLNENLRSEMGRVAEKRARKEQSWERRVSEYDALLRDTAPIPDAVNVAGE